MKNLFAVASLTVAATLAAGLALTPAAATATASSTAVMAPGDIDLVHSSLVFKIKHADVANFYGVFKQFSGSFKIDQSTPAASTLSITVDAASVDSRNTARDKHIISPDYLSAKEFPQITFRSTAFTKTADKTYDVTGDLTFRGVTKPITAKLVQTDENGRGIEATFTIKRTDFGNALGKGLSDEVSFIVSLESSSK